MSVHDLSSVKFVILSRPIYLSLPRHRCQACGHTFVLGEKIIIARSSIRMRLFHTACFHHESFKVSSYE